MEIDRYRKRPLRRKKTRSSPSAEGPAPVVHALAEEAAPESNPSFPVVGVGASAGGLDAFTRFLRALPADTGMAFVLVQHLAPSRESALAEILSRATSMPVTEVTDEPQIQPNRVYVIPPNRDMTIVRGHLRLSARETSPHHPIDRLFRSLAESQRHAAIGVVLSGTATDGTLGLEEIKAQGGITFAQDVTAQYDGMPHSAVASGAVDFVLPPEGIAGEIARIAAHPFVAPNEADAAEETRGSSLTRGALAPILQLLGFGTGVDFTQYKPNTLARRITRRMVLARKEGAAEYAEFLRDNAAEVEALYQDILINVTSFFRDPEMFEVLKARVIPALLQHRSRRSPLRAWVLGCSTGEEAYSLAMVLSEAMDSSGHHAPVQLFATDLNLAAVERARAGVYAKERMGSVSRERLHRFFEEVDGGYRVRQSIREMCIFSRHNMLDDPPFSRMDLVSCRNLLIYLEPAVQQRIVSMVHYGLKPGGYLVLGASETVGQFRDRFEVGDAKHKIFISRPGSLRMPIHLPAPGGGPDHVGGAMEVGNLSRVTPGLLGPDLFKEADRLLLGFAPAAVLVDGDLEVLQFRGNIEPYLVPAQGKASFALLKMARPGLLLPLRTLLQRARRETDPVPEERVRLRSRDGVREVRMRVCAVKGPSASDRGFLVVFEDLPIPEPRGRAGNPRAVPRSERESAAKTSVRLEDELARTREYLQSLGEQNEAAMDALRAANEEAQSANEELQSINEELETSKEEIQSNNEELTTINDELNNRNLELSTLNGDLTNLIASVQLAIVIVGRDLRIRRFSPVAEKLLNMIPTDVGRFISDLRMSVGLSDVSSLLTEVIETVSPVEREIAAKDGRWYHLRIRPYLTQERKIDGAVLTMTDIDAIRRAREYAESIVHTVQEPILILDDDLRVRTANRSYCEFFRVTKEETEGRPLYELGNGQWNIFGVRQILGALLPNRPRVDDVVVEQEFERLGPRVLRLSSRRLDVPGEERHAILLAFADISESVRAEREHERLELELRERSEEVDAASRAKSDFLALLSHELRTPLNAISNWAELLKHPGVRDEERIKGMEVIARNSRLQAQLISDLLDVQRIATGKLSLDLREVDLRGEVQAAVDAAVPAAQGKGIRVERKIDAAPVLVLGDSSRLQQVLGNLLSNAIKFTPDGGEIRVALLGDGSRAHVVVSDSGEGIDPESLSRIFERFRQGESRSRGGGGLGLGLAVTRQLVELHDGTVSARSAGKGTGSTFTVSLPLLTGARVVVTPAEVDRSLESLRGFVVLVVDDEAEAREPLRRLLEARGAEVLTVRSADEALDAIQQQQPHVLVSDLGMPGRDGYHLLRAVRALSPGKGGQIPAIALTAFDTTEERERASKAGYATFLSKPVEPAALVAAVAALLRPPPNSVTRTSEGESR